VRAREQLIEIQKSLAKAAKSEIYEALGPLSAPLQRYSDEYYAQFPGEASPVELEAIETAVTDANVAYFGDYHTLLESQKAPLRILESVVATGRKLILTTEVVQLVHQDHLDAYLAGDLDEGAFLSAIEYDRTWGFNWRNYRLHFEFARQHEIQMLAINTDPRVGHDNLEFRDSMAGMLIVEALCRNPDALIAVLFGDLHVAPNHIPARVKQYARGRKIDPIKEVIVYQNVDSVYWSLVERELEQSTQAVRVDVNSFCMVNTTPLVMYQSYLNWELNQEELEESVGLDTPHISSTVMTDQIHEIVHTICRFLELPNRGLDDFTVHTSRDLDLLDRLIEERRMHRSDLEEFKEQVEQDESFFLVDQKLIYLGNLSIDHAAEEATHYINTKLSGHVRNPPNAVFDFYYRTLKEAIGFLGSKVICQKRSCYHRADFEQLLKDTRGKRLNDRMTQIRQVSRDVLVHLNFEQKFLESNGAKYPRFQKLYCRPLSVHIGITHSLGYILGDLIYTALMNGEVRRSEVRSFFEERFVAEDRPRELYFDWVKRLS